MACLTLGGMEDDGASMAERFVVGTGFIEPDAEESKRGRVLVFEHAGEGSYRQVGEAETRGAVHAIAGLPDGKFAVTSNSEVGSTLARAHLTLKHFLTPIWLALPDHRLRLERIWRARISHQLGRSFYRLQPSLQGRPAMRCRSSTLRVSAAFR